jgi:hypothetical protein
VLIDDLNDEIRRRPSRHGLAPIAVYAFARNNGDLRCDRISSTGIILYLSFLVSAEKLEGSRTLLLALTPAGRTIRDGHRSNR